MIAMGWSDTEGPKDLCGKASHIINDLRFVVAGTSKLKTLSIGGLSKRCSGHEFPNPGNEAREAGQKAEEF